MTTKELECIFVDRPHDCPIQKDCLVSIRLQCLMNKRHLLIRPTVAAEMHELLDKVINDPERYKTLSGEADREKIYKGKKYGRNSA